VRVSYVISPGTIWTLQNSTDVRSLDCGATPGKPRYKAH
jgi:hypothetical protein